MEILIQISAIIFFGIGIWCKYQTEHRKNKLKFKYKDKLK